MKKYIKPSVEIVSLKSSVDIAASYKGVRNGIVDSYLRQQDLTQYTVTQYTTSYQKQPTA